MWKKIRSERLNGLSVICRNNLQKINFTRGEVIGVISKISKRNNNKYYLKIFKIFLF